ncbi:hypothetical protein [Mesorhizobium sp. URHB0026]
MRPYYSKAIQRKALFCKGFRFWQKGKQFPISPPLRPPKSCFRPNFHLVEVCRRDAKSSESRQRLVWQALRPVSKVPIYGHMGTTERIAELEADLAGRDDKIKQMTTDLAEARDLVDRMREHVDDVSSSIETWVTAFDLSLGEDGVWKIDRSQSDVWEKHLQLHEEHLALIRKWNKFVPEYNAAILARDIGRPLAASEAQRADVLKRHKAGESLRAISKATALGLRTVRTIIDKHQGTDRASKRANELRRVEFNRQRAAAFRVRKRGMEAMPKQIGELQKAGAALVKRAKGLGK